MGKPLRKTIVISSGLALVALIGVIATPPVREWLQPRPISSTRDRASAVLPLVGLPAEERRAQLEKIAASERATLDRSRARYLLAMDFLRDYQGGPAVEQLERLEQDYPVLAPYVLLKRGRGYELANNREQAQEIWQQVIDTYPDSPYAAEALYLLGRSSPAPDYWDRAIAAFPAHPRTHQIVRERLQDDPNQLPLLLLLARYDADAWDVRTVRDRLAAEYASQLTPEDWQSIADGYWQQWAYDKAAQAYEQAPATPRNLYRLARSLHVDEQEDKARVAYRRLIDEFPQSPETGLGLRRLASLGSGKEALTYLDRAIAYPDEAPAALLAQAEILDNLGSRTAAAEARQTLLDNYPDSEAAAQYRWQVAQRYAEQGNLANAWQWAQAIATNNPDSSIAPKAAFWVGKWAQRLDQQQEAHQAFEHVLARHPESYYAWRSAVLLGWEVGDFDTVRQMAPAVSSPLARTVPPAGSETFQELYRLGEDGDARLLFEAEIGDREVTVPEQFTEALLLSSQGNYLQAINQVWSLQERDSSAEQQQWQELRQTPAYWQTLFPFPFNDTILAWSQERQLNPLLVTSLIRQESRFETAIQSPVGATGLMQVMPATGQWVATNLDLEDYSLSDPEDNINLGTWYLDHTHQTYNNNSLFAVASYNAGPGNVSQWIERYSFSDPDVFVENIPFPETKGYIESVFGNYWNYLRIYNPDVAEQLSRYSTEE
ncbi:MAG: transglycosylase SLT domain-containing protein [Cyanophyceae cyanobacterium]